LSISIARGNVHYELKSFADALAAFDHALRLKPDYAEAHNSRGNAALECNRIEEALACYDRALALKPDYADALVNRGNALRALGRADAAIESFDRALALNPQMPEAHWNKGLACLSLGDFARGWTSYEWRWRRNTTEMTAREFAQPQWRGEDLQDRTILLHAEQDFGDTIQFIRYLPMVIARGAKVVLEIPDDLRPLIPPTGGVIALVRRGEPLPPFDLHCPLMSLPLAFATTLDTIPAQVPYLHAPADRVERWRARLAGLPAPRVGLVWSGKPTHRNDHNRSLALGQLAPLLRRPGVSFVSLQKEYRDADRAELAQSPITRLEDALADFANTAAAIAALDLVIAVDTAVAHLAGAMATAAARHRRLALARATLGQPLVSKRAPVPAAANRRLAKRARRRCARTRFVRAKERPSRDRLTGPLVNFPPDCATMRKPWHRDRKKPSRARRRASPWSRHRLRRRTNSPRDSPRRLPPATSPPCCCGWPRATSAA
jgi:lipoprotein NlpI